MTTNQQPDFGLSGQTVLVTGASRGIGLAIAQAAAASGADHVVLNGIDENELRQAAAAIDPSGARASHVVADVFSEAAVVQMFADLEARFGFVQSVFSNAGMNIRIPTLEMSGADFGTVINANLLSHFYVGREAARRMRHERRGSIVFTASITTLVGRPRLAAYTTAKSGLGGLTRCLAAELGPYSARANAICPGFIETTLSSGLHGNPDSNSLIRSRVPAARWGRPDDISGPALFLASDAARYVNGHLLVVDGGMTEVFDEHPITAAAERAESSGPTTVSKP